MYGFPKAEDSELPRKALEATRPHTDLRTYACSLGAYSLEAYSLELIFKATSKATKEMLLGCFAGVICLQVSLIVFACPLLSINMSLIVLKNVLNRL